MPLFVTQGFQLRFGSYDIPPAEPVCSVRMVEDNDRRCYYISAV